jgi:F-type H+-transporting ATPase subunit c
VNVDIQAIAIIVAGATIAIGSIGPALGEGRAVAAALDAIARQPDSAGLLSRTLFVGLAMVESTAIYCLVVSLLLLFKATPLLQPAAAATGAGQ